ncbi:hypothetical protein APR12_006718 [Nocardia amikacinitolerans]|nr:hypothetical protein [Nocardia amikacinitolerans]
MVGRSGLSSRLDRRPPRRPGRCASSVTARRFEGSTSRAPAAYGSQPDSREHPDRRCPPPGQTDLKSPSVGKRLRCGSPNGLRADVGRGRPGAYDDVAADRRIEVRWRRSAPRPSRPPRAYQLDGGGSGADDRGAAAGQVESTRPAETTMRRSRSTTAAHCPVAAQHPGAGRRRAVKSGRSREKTMRRSRLTTAAHRITYYLPPWLATAAAPAAAASGSRYSRGRTGRRFSSSS